MANKSKEVIPTTEQEFVANKISKLEELGYRAVIAFAVTGIVVTSIGIIEKSVPTTFIGGFLLANAFAMYRELGNIADVSESTDQSTNQ